MIEIKPWPFKPIEVKEFDDTRTQWFCCETEPPVHNGVYELRAKPEKLPKLKVVSMLDYDANRGIYAWDGYCGYMGWFQWRGLAVKP